MNLPEARTSNIIEHEADRELLIYDLRTDKAYTLNETLKINYKACGKTTAEELKRKHKFTDDLIHFSLDELSANNLIEDYESTHFAGLSRREVIRKVGLATMAALPLIAAIVAPSSAAAASTANQCRTLNCVDRVGNNLGGGCNPPNGCAAIGLVCCASTSRNFCTCAPADLCPQLGGQVCS